MIDDDTTNIIKSEADTNFNDNNSNKRKCQSYLVHYTSKQINSMYNDKFEYLMYDICNEDIAKDESLHCSNTNRHRKKNTCDICEKCAFSLYKKQNKNM